MDSIRWLPCGGTTNDINAPGRSSRNHHNPTRDYIALSLLAIPIFIMVRNRYPLCWQLHTKLEAAPSARSTEFNSIQSCSVPREQRDICSCEIMSKSQNQATAGRTCNQRRMSKQQFARPRCHGQRYWFFPFVQNILKRSSSLVSLSNYLIVDFNHCGSGICRSVKAQSFIYRIRRNITHLLMQVGSKLQPSWQ
jgi:hypothetical protein